MQADIEAGHVIHILCTQGGLSFLHQGTLYNAVATDYVILPNAALASELVASKDFEAILMAFPLKLSSSLAIRSGYGAVGMLSLLLNPVMKLTRAEYARCREDLLRMRQRVAETTHIFLDEMLEHLLAAHVLDLYNMHAQSRPLPQTPKRSAALLMKFLDDLSSGSYRAHRSLDWYARRLFVTPHYLSEVCRRASGRSAGYFIDLFTTQEIARRLSAKGEPIQRIAESLGFSSFSYFSRYVKKELGMSPSDFRASRNRT